MGWRYLWHKIWYDQFYEAEKERLKPCVDARGHVWDNAGYGYGYSTHKCTRGCGAYYIIDLDIPEQR